MDRNGLADFLRRSRARLAPGDVGLTQGSRRRTPGLRREEVSALAGMSADYYTRLEQSRGPRPSRQILTALARALRLTDDGRDHLFRLAGEEPPGDRPGSGHVRPGLLLVLDQLRDVPATVMSDLGDILAQNALSVALTGDALARPPQQRNVIRMFFLTPQVRSLFPPEDHAAYARAHVAHLRSVRSARPGDPRVRALVDELLAGSEEFAALWERHEVAVRRSSVKRFRHLVVGLLELDCEVLLSPAHDQQLILYTARPGSESYERLRLLRVTGLQDLTPDSGRLTQPPPVPRAPRRP